MFVNKNFRQMQSFFGKVPGSCGALLFPRVASGLEFYLKAVDAEKERSMQGFLEDVPIRVEVG